MTRFSSIVIVLITLFAVTATAEELQRPKFSVLPYNENWSSLADHDLTATGDWFDRIKYVPFNEDGSIWASFGGQLRLRGEVWNNFGFTDAGDSDDAFLLTRVLLHADVHFGQHVRVFIEGKSALSTDGDAPVGNRPLEVDELALQNAFGEVTLPIGDQATFMLRGGRQELLYGKQRLVSPLDWANSRRTFDGVRGDLTWGDWVISGFWTLPVVTDKYDFNDSDGNTHFYGIYATGPVCDTGWTGDLYWLALDRDASSIPGGGFNGTAGDEERHTLGARLAGKIADTAFDFDVEGAYQFGEVGSGDIQAFMFAGEVGYTIADCPANPRVHLGFDYASGDDSPGGDVETFNQLYPLGHAYFGWIDIVGRQNIIDITPGVTFKPIDKMVVNLNGHFFWRAEEADALYNAGGGVVPGRTGGPGTSREIGSEIDLMVKYQFDRHLTGIIGYSHLFAGDFIEETGSHSDIDFGYLILQYTF
jgi:hypothetical protein